MSVEWRDMESLRAFDDAIEALRRGRERIERQFVNKRRTSKPAHELKRGDIVNYSGTPRTVMYAPDRFADGVRVLFRESFGVQTQLYPADAEIALWTLADQERLAGTDERAADELDTWQAS